MSVRILTGIVPSSFKVMKALRPVLSPTTHKKYFSHYPNDVASPSILKVRERRLFSQQTKVKTTLTVDYDYVNEATRKDNIVIIDVREAEEVKEHGKIPNSINIPLANVVPVLSNLTENEFQKIYERAKPKQDTEIIFYCMIGKRSGKAQENALSLGFKNAKNYLGSWTDWATKTQ